VKLAEYLETTGVTIRELAKKTQRRWQTIQSIVEGRAEPLPETARRIEEATEGRVTAASLLGLERSRKRAANE
jgi:plasmid maintenance system antidote protein VapI